jgi:hypothetical protein
VQDLRCFKLFSPPLGFLLIADQYKQLQLAETSLFPSHLSAGFSDVPQTSTRVRLTRCTALLHFAQDYVALVDG